MEQIHRTAVWLIVRWQKSYVLIQMATAKVTTLYVSTSSMHNYKNYCVPFSSVLLMISTDDTVPKVLKRSLKCITSDSKSFNIKLCFFRNIQTLHTRIFFGLNTLSYPPGNSGSASSPFGFRNSNSSMDIFWNCMHIT